MINYKGITVFKEVNEDWYSNYHIADDVRYTGKYVSIRISKLFDGLFRVCVWGNDDLGMDRDFEVESDAVKMFQTLVIVEELTKQFLSENGFGYF